MFVCWRLGRVDEMLQARMFAKKCVCDERLGWDLFSLDFVRDPFLRLAVTALPGKLAERAPLRPKHCLASMHVASLQSTRNIVNNVYFSISTKSRYNTRDLMKPRYTTPYISDQTCIYVCCVWCVLCFNRWHCWGSIWSRISSLVHNRAKACSC